MSTTRMSWRIALGLLAGAVLLLGASCSGDASAQPVSLTVQPSTYGRAIPSGFVGMSMELKNFPQYAGTDPKALDPAFVQLLRDIAPNQPSVLRLGGDGTDWSWWPIPHVVPPGGIKYSLTPQWMSVARSVATSLNAKLILGINLEANSRRIAAAEGNAMVSRIGSRYIDALEIGNEPELYGSFSWYKAANGQHIHGRPLDYNETDYEHDFANVANALPRVAIAGPSSGGLNWLAHLGAYLKAEPKVRLTTIHDYPLKHCTKSSPSPTIAQLLSNSSSAGFAQRVAGWVRAAHARGIKIRLDEMNAISCGGVRGVSDTFASALWIPDALFQLEKIGVDGVNVHTVPNTINEVLGPTFTHGKWSVRVHPEYYGMILFAQAAPPGSKLMRLSTKLPAGVRAWATRTASGQVRVLLINDQATRSASLHLSIPGTSSAASVEALRAPSINAKSGITLGGQSFGSATTTGQLAGKSTTTSITPTKGSYNLTLPGASAELLTF